MSDVAVLDASAVIDASHPGREFDLLTRLHERFTAVAPALLAWELGSVVHGRLARGYGATPARRALALETMLEGIELVATDAAARSATAALAARHGLTFYDASYLALAAGRDGPQVLVTQDKAMLRAAARELGREKACTINDIDALLARAGA